MSDRYSQLVNNPIGGFVAKNVGLPQPVELDRYEPGRPLIDGSVLLGAAPGGRLGKPIAQVLALSETDTDTPPDGDLRTAVADGDLDAGIWNPDAPSQKRFKALVFDATGIAESSQLRQLWEFFHPSFRYLLPSGRVIVLGTPPEDCKAPRAATAQRALEGFTRAIAKEARAGATAQLVYVKPGAEARLESTLRFFLSPRSAYVSGQVVRVGDGGAVPEARLGAAAGGQGRARDRRLARDRRGDRADPGPRRRPRGRARHPAAGRGPEPRRRRDRRLGDHRRHHQRRRPGRDLQAAERGARRRRHRRPQRRRHQGQDDRRHGRRALGRPDGHQPLERGADQRRAARRQGPEQGRPRDLRLLDQRHRRQRRPDQLRDLEGRA